ncbi:MAG: hypothetical protein M1825_001988 [Sarcosagium campestre]|nr:MAG: hypothetical protein M1825_001988 [Sarcosagium campestre]
MASYQLPDISTVPSLPTLDCARILDQLFEPSEQLHTLSLQSLRDQRFETYKDLIASVTTQLINLAESTSTTDTAWLDLILSAHPRLGESHVKSAQSQAEQAQLHTGEDAELKELRSCNEAYEKAFPGLRYVVFVNGRGRDVILAEMRSRIRRADIGAERVDIIKAMSEIAIDRAAKMHKSPE